jgi:hypothetical protein
VILFNSLQFVVAFVFLPFLIVWLSSATFNGAYLAMAAACVLHLGMALIMVVAVAMMFEKK